MKKIFDGLGTTLLFAFSIILIACGIFAITSDSYTAGKNSVQPTVVEQTLAIVNLNNENAELKNSILTIEGDNYALRILAQTQEEELDNLKSTVDSLNQSIANLESDNANLDEVIPKLNTDVTYLNTYIGKLENTISTIVDKYVVMVLPKEFANSSVINTYLYNDKVYFYASEVDNIYIYDLSTGTYSTAIKEDEVEYEMETVSGGVSFSTVYNNKLFFCCVYGDDVYAIDVNTNQLSVISTLGSSSSLSIYIFDDINTIMFQGDGSNTIFYNDVTKESLLVRDVFPVSSTYGTLYRIVNNKVYFAYASKLVCVNLDTFTYTSTTFTGSCSYYGFDATEDYVLICVENNKIYELKVFDSSTLELLSTFNSSSYWVQKRYNGYLLTNDCWYIFNSAYIGCLDFSTLTYTEISIDFTITVTCLNFKVFDNHILFWHTENSKTKGIYKLDVATKTVTLIDGTDNFYSLSWCFETENKWFVRYSSSLYVYDKTSITFSLFTSDFSEIYYLTEDDNYYYFVAVKAGYGVIKIDKELAGYEIVFNTTGSCWLWKVFDDYALIRFFDKGIYLFDFETLECNKIYSDYSSSVTFTLAENFEDYYISSANSKYVLYFDVSERTLSLYSYNIDV